MNAEITVTLPEDVLQRAELLARRAGRPVAELLAETIELSFRPLGPVAQKELPIKDWTDEEVLAAADAQMKPADDQRLSDLLDRQQAVHLSSAERAELAALMEIYQAGLLRKAQALREAVRRGLRGTIEP